MGPDPTARVSKRYWDMCQKNTLILFSIQISGRLWKSAQVGISFAFWPQATQHQNLTLISQIGRVFDRKSQHVCFSGKEGAVKEWRAELRAAAMFMRGVKV